MWFNRVSKEGFVKIDNWQKPHEILATELLLKKCYMYRNIVNIISHVSKRKQFNPSCRWRLLLYVPIAGALFRRRFTHRAHALQGTHTVPDARVS